MGKEKDRAPDYKPRHDDPAKVLARINDGLPPGYKAILDPSGQRVIFKEVRPYGGITVAQRGVEEIVDWMEPGKVGDYVLRYEKGKGG